MPTLSTGNSILVSLVKAAQLLTDAMFARTDKDNYPKTNSLYNRNIYSIRDATSVSAPITNGTLSSIQVIINLEKAPYAKAYEWGVSSPYMIQMKPGGKRLTFPKERWPTYKPPPPPRSIFVFDEVQHPYIHAVPYITPALLETKETIRKTIGADFVASIISKETTVIKVTIN